jgi:mannose-6-phosphate isomerase-like protein (cupin superfamily)
VNVVNLAEKFSRFTDYWNPRIVGEVNDLHVKVVKLKGEFIWHHHEKEDELFLVTRGTLRMQFREGGQEREVKIGPGEFVVVPKGTEHRPIGDEEVHIVLFEPRSTLNTGNVINERTVADLQEI